MKFFCFSASNIHNLKILEPHKIIRTNEQNQKYKIQIYSFRSLSDNNMKVTVQKGKGAVTVLNWGGPPFIRLEETKKKQHHVYYIPNGFTVLTTADYRHWVGESRTLSGVAEFSFQLYGKETPREKLCWATAPSNAYHLANTMVRNRRYTKGNNGRLILGLFYEPIQKRLRNIFGDQMDKCLFDPSITYPLDCAPSLLPHQLPSIKKKVKSTSAKKKAASVIPRKCSRDIGSSSDDQEKIEEEKGTNDLTDTNSETSFTGVRKKLRFADTEQVATEYHTPETNKNICFEMQSNVTDNGGMEKEDLFSEFDLIEDLVDPEVIASIEELLG